jgi:hypothetical protein
MRCWLSAATYRAIYVAEPKAKPISKETARDLHGRFRPSVSLMRMAVTYQVSGTTRFNSHRPESRNLQVAGAVGVERFQALACLPTEAVTSIAFACCSTLMNRLSLNRRIRNSTT